MNLFDARGRPLDNVTFGQVRGAASLVMNRRDFASRANITFGGDRRIHDALGYANELSIDDFRSRYQRSEIAARVVEMYPKDTWRGGFKVIETEDPEETTPFEAAWDALALRLNLAKVFERVDILARLGRYAALVTGAPGNVDQPLKRVSKPEDIAYVTAFAEDDAVFNERDVVTDVRDPRCGYPNFYHIRRMHGAQKFFSDRYHYTRITHVAEGALDHPLFAPPVLERVWNRLDDLEKVVGAGSEAFWLRAHQGFVLAFDKEQVLEDDDIESYHDKAEEFAHQQRRTLALQGGTFESLGSDVADFSPQVAALISLIAGGTAYPQRMLIGSERGELASTEDRMAYERRVDDRRDGHAEPVIVRPFIDLMIKIKALPEPKEYSIRWPGVDNLDDSGRALVARQWALVNNSMKERVVTPDEIRTRVLNLPPLAEILPDDLKDPFEEERKIKEKAQEQNAFPENGNPEGKRETENPNDREKAVEKTKDVPGVM